MEELISLTDHLEYQTILKELCSYLRFMLSMKRFVYKNVRPLSMMVAEECRSKLDVIICYTGAG
jgi:hypothetical protein